MISDETILGVMNSDVARIPLLVHMDWPAAPVFLHNRVGEKYWDTKRWTGVGMFGSISEAESGTGLGQMRMNLVTNDLPTLSEATQDNAVGRAVKMYIAATNEHRRIIAAQLIAYKFIASVNVDNDNAYSTISISLGSARERFRNAKSYQRYQPKAWRKAYPGDSYCDDVAALSAGPLNSYSGNQAVGGGSPRGDNARYRTK